MLQVVGVEARFCLESIFQLSARLEVEIQAGTDLLMKTGMGHCQGPHLTLLAATGCDHALVANLMANLMERWMAAVNRMATEGISSLAQSEGIRDMVGILDLQLQHHSSSFDSFDAGQIACVEVIEDRRAEVGVYVEGIAMIGTTHEVVGVTHSSSQCEPYWDQKAQWS